MAYLNAGQVWLGTVPNISFTVAYEQEREGATVRIRLRVTTSKIVSPSYFGYNLQAQPTINGSAQSAQTIKNNSPSTWSSPITTYFPSSTGWYTTTISNLAQTSMSFSMRFYSNSGNSKTGSFAATIPNVAASLVASDVDFVIGDNLPIQLQTYSTAYTHTARLYVADTLISTLDNVGEMAIFDIAAQAADIYALTPNSATVSVRVEIDTYNGTTLVGTSDKTGTAYVANSAPVFADFAVETDAVSQTLTGSPTAIISGYSSLVISINAPATAQNASTMASYIVACGDITQTVAYTGSAQTIMLDNVNGSSISVAAVDSRGLQTVLTKLLSVLAYTPIELAPIALSRTNNVDETVTLTYTGNIWGQSFGAVQNAVKTASWRYKLTTADEWTVGGTNIMPTITGDIFAFTGQIAGPSPDDGWISQNSYNVEITVSDNVSSNTISGVINTGEPGVYMRKINGEYWFGVGKVPTLQGIDTVGDVNITGSYLVNGEPLVAGMQVDVLWQNASPSSTFAAQTVSVDLSDYAYYAIIAVVGTSSGTYYRRALPTPWAPTNMSILLSFAWGDIDRQGHRTANPVGTTGISFTGGYYDSATNNNMVIPYQILGIKGVGDVRN